MDWIRKFGAVRRSGVADISFTCSHFVCKNLNVAGADYLLIFWDLLTLFFATFIQKQASNNHLTKGNLLKWKTKKLYEMKNKTSAAYMVQ